jgi:hypothetical protein
MDFKGEKPAVELAPKMFRPSNYNPVKNAEPQLTIAEIADKSSSFKNLISVTRKQAGVSKDIPLKCLAKFGRLNNVLRR